jgi:hypothetical protein
MVVLSVALVSCGLVSPRPPNQETGIVISADGPNAADVDRFTLRTEDGRVLQLRVGRLDVSNGGLPAPHLREHLLNGEPITVFYYGDEIFRYIDAPP